MSKAIKVGQTYLCKVGRNSVEVKVLNTCDGGWVVASAKGRTLTIKDAARLSAIPAVAADSAQGAPGAKMGARAPKCAKAARGRDVGQKGAPRGEGKRLGLVDAAIQVMKAAGKPMNCQEVVKAILEQKLWVTEGRTPSATLYSSILREIQKKGAEARFKKVDRGQFALAG